MTFTIDHEASREEWDAFLEAVEADAAGDTDTDGPESSGSPNLRTQTRSSAAPDVRSDSDPELVELLTEVWGFHVGLLPGR